MNGKFSKTLLNFHKGEKGITGLETAIILIAFVTVAAVLAYSVLSAGIFSSERGQEAVYSGLEQAQASMQVVGNVYAEGTVDVVPANSSVNLLRFQIGSVLGAQDVDLGQCVVNYQDDAVVEMAIEDTLTTGFTGVLEPNEVQEITVNVSGYGLAVYDQFTIEIIPATGASIQIQRTIPGSIDAVMNLY